MHSLLILLDLCRSVLFEIYVHKHFNFDFSLKKSCVQFVHCGPYWMLHKILGARAQFYKQRLNTKGDFQTGGDIVDDVDLYDFKWIFLSHFFLLIKKWQARTGQLLVKITSCWLLMTLLPCGFCGKYFSQLIAIFTHDSHTRTSNLNEFYPQIILANLHFKWF